MVSTLKITISALVVCVVCLFVLVADAQTGEVETRNGTVYERLTPFQDTFNVVVPALNVPTVVEVPLGDISLYRNEVVVLEQETNRLDPVYVKRQENTIPQSFAHNGSGQARYLGDNNYDTHVAFEVPAEYSEGGDALYEAVEPKATLEVFTDQAITSSGFTVVFADHVAHPDFFEVRATDPRSGASKVLVAKTRFASPRVSFPQETASRWQITFWYSQPLRISELDLADDSRKSFENAIRFLARPGMTYEVYLNPDRRTNVPTSELTNLREDEGVVIVQASAARDNPVYVESDVDGDGVKDNDDNCVQVPNPDQLDIDQNNRGDVCDDFDRDGRMNSQDNCPEHPNRYQRDEDGDGIGDECDSEESRFTERYPWTPWVGIGFAGVVLVTLFSITALSMRRNEDEHIVADDVSGGGDEPPARV